MNSVDVFGYISSLEKENEELRSELEARPAINLDRFYGATFTSGDVARLHGVSRGRVVEYAKRRLLPLHPDSTDERLLFRASDVLAWDFGQLRKEARRQ